MPMVTAWQCAFDPTDLPGAPMGQMHCPSCGCMVIAGLLHGPCFKALCPAAEEGWHTGPEIEVDVTEDDLPWLT